MTAQTEEARHTPDVIIAGFNRCGTSTLHALLNQHPQICMSTPKELHIYNHDTHYQERGTHYARALDHCHPACLRGEATPSYIYNGLLFQQKNTGYYFDPDNDSIKRIARDAPETKIILSLRNPVDAALSHFNKARLQGREHHRTKLIDAMRAEWNGERTIHQTDLCYSYLTQYSRHIQHLFEHIPRERVAFLIFEEWTADQQATLDRLSVFLGLEPHEMEHNEAIIKNTGRRALMPGLRDMLETILPRRLVMPVYRRLATRKGYAHISPEDHQAIAAHYSEEVKTLEALIGRDLSLWQIPGHHQGPESANAG